MAGEEIGHGEAFLRGDEASYGYAVTSGDYNADGTYDYVISSTLGFVGGYGQGNVEGTDRHQFTFRHTVDVSALSADDLEDIGVVSLATGDYNGDQVDDLAVALPLMDEVYIFYGGAGLVWASSMNESDADLLLTGASDSFFGFGLAAGNFGGGTTGLVVGAPGAAGGAGEVSIYGNVLTQSVVKITGEADQAIGAFVTVGNLFAGSGDSLVASGNVLYALAPASLSGNANANAVAEFKIEAGGDLVVSAMTVHAGPGNTTLFIGVADTHTVYGYHGAGGHSGTLTLADADIVITDPSSGFLGMEISSKDVDQDGYADLSLTATAFTTALGTLTNATGVVYVLSGTEVGEGSHTLWDVTPLVIFYGEDYTLFGGAVSFGDFNGDGFMDILGGGIGRYEVISSGLDPFPSIDIGAQPKSGLAPLSTILQSTKSFGTVTWFVDDQTVGVGDSIVQVFAKGEYTISARAERNGFLTEASSVLVVSTNNPPEILMTLSEYTVNTFDSVTVYALASDLDGDPLGIEMTHDGNAITPTNSGGNAFSYGLAPQTRGTHVFATEFADDEESVTRSISLRVMNNPPEALLRVDSSSGLVGKAFSFSCNVSDAENDDLQVALSVGGTTVASGTGNLSYIFTSTEAGTVSYSASVADQEDQEQSGGTLVLFPNVVENSPPSISLALSATSVTMGDDVAITMIFSDPDSGSLSPSLSVNGAALALSGSGNVRTHEYSTTGQRGLFTVAASVTDGAAMSSVYKTFSVQNYLPHLSLALSKNVAVTGETITAEITFSDIDGDSVTPSLHAGGLPVSLWGTGQSRSGSFIAPAAGTLCIVATAYDGYESKTITRTLEVLGQAPPPELQIFASPNPISAGNTATLTIISSGDGLDFGSIGLWAEGNVLALTGSGPVYTASYTPGYEGDHEITAGISNSVDLAVTQSLVLRVGEGNTPPVITLSASGNMLLGEMQTVSLSGADMEGNPLSYALYVDGAAVALSGSGSSRSYAFTPGGAGLYRLSGVLSDGYGTSTMEAYVHVGSAAADIDGVDLRMSRENVEYGGNVLIRVVLDDAGQSPLLVVNGVTRTLVGTGTERTFDWSAESEGAVQVSASVTSSANTITVSENIGVFPDPAPNKSPFVYLSADKGGVMRGDLVTYGWHVVDSEADPVTMNLFINSTLVSSAGNTYVWTADASGSIPVLLSASDGHSTQSLAMTQTVYNRLPEGNIHFDDNSITVTESVNVTVRASDPDGQALAISLMQNGTVVAIDTGNSTLLYSFEPEVGMEGVYTFTALIEDGEGSQTISKTMEVTPIVTNAVPVVSLSLSSFAIEEDESATLSVSASDANNDPLGFTATKNGVAVALN
ncbi:MAG: hypothetical protein HQL31_05955, partial [Planctomycetes bacterium]|nr:hypothetical protein [Planctomycetota bacterium]